MDIGICYTLKTDVPARLDAPDDALEEYDSEQTIDAIQRALEEDGHSVRRLGYGRAFLEGVLERRPALVFNVAEGVGSRSREAHVPAVLEMLGIPFTHSDPLTLSAAQDKAVAKRIVASFGCATPAFQVIERPEDLDDVRLRYPLFAKPLCEGSSMGVHQDSRVEGPEELRERVAGLLEGYRQPVLVEEFCPGAEFTTAILGTGAGARVLGTRGVRRSQVAQDRFVYSLEIKRNDGLQAPDALGDYAPGLVEEVESLALRSYRALGCRDVGRVDVRVDAAGVPRFLELNALPGLAPGWSDLSLIAAARGMDHASLIRAITGHARARYGL